MTPNTLTVEELDALEQRAHECAPSFCPVHQNEIFSLIAAARLGLSSGWQPIETAPKDGTRIILGERFDIVQIGWWREDHQGWYNTINRIAATHWQPLPPPPQQEREDSELIDDARQPGGPLSRVAAPIPTGETAVLCPICGEDYITCRHIYIPGRCRENFPSSTPPTDDMKLVETLYDDFNSKRGNGETDYAAFISVVTATIAEKDAEIERLRTEIANRETGTLWLRLENAQATIAALREALEWFADANNYEDSSEGDPSEVACDGVKRASAALAHKEE